MKKLVIEYHYKDGDVGAYHAEKVPAEGAAALVLWEGFATSPLAGQSNFRHEPKCIIIREATESEG